MRHISLLGLMTAFGLSACVTAPPETPTIIIEPEPIRTCAPVSTLTKVVIPAETKKQTAITMIDNPPYAPIESRVERTVVVKPAEVFYVNANNQQVIDICESDIEIGRVGPGPGSVINPDGSVTYPEE